jgi:hypothetical protein
MEVRTPVVFISQVWKETHDEPIHTISYEVSHRMPAPQTIAPTEKSAPTLISIVPDKSRSSSEYGGVWVECVVWLQAKYS